MLLKPAPHLHHTALLKSSNVALDSGFSQKAFKLKPSGGIEVFGQKNQTYSLAKLSKRLNANLATPVWPFLCLERRISVIP
jgi:hypothetical protein